ncbi:MAG TPA: sigma-70 family RNA polymerase sigma factor [Bryobacteraceae bacterium]|jgi:RNA polymerase sigma-70 factor, ECF subfamily|nr:sigma-70 family RNA polymerase sigma factor [Bryobacteraceae bacterium]
MEHSDEIGTGVPSFRPKPDITALLRKVSAGDLTAREQLFAVVYAELRRLARLAMRNERCEHTLQPTALVNEAYLRLFGEGGVDWQNRAHFFNVAGQTMRRILVDHARGFRSKKRWAGQRVEIDDRLGLSQEKSVALVVLDEALERLESLDSRQCRIVELRFFAGLTNEEAAAALGINVRTVKRDWQMARAWLHSQITT